MAGKQCFLVCPPSGNMASKQCFLVCLPLRIMVRKECFLVCPHLRNMARKQCFLVCPPSGNMARKQCFLVCPPLRNMARKQCLGFVSCSFSVLGISCVHWFLHFWETWSGDNDSHLSHIIGNSAKKQCFPQMHNLLDKDVAFKKGYFEQSINHSTF